MGGIASNDAELKDMLAGPIQRATTLMMMNVQTENRKEISVTVYGGYASTEYDRTGEFGQAWKVGREGGGNIASADMEYAPDLIHEAHLPWTHVAFADGNSVSKGDSSAEELADYIFNGYQGALPKAIPARNSFDKTDKWFNEQKVSNLFEKGLTTNGLKVTQKGGADKSVF